VFIVAASRINPSTFRSGSGHGALRTDQRFETFPGDSVKRFSAPSSGHRETVAAKEEANPGLWP